MLGTVWVNFEIFVTNISIMIESSFLFEIIYEKSLEYFFFSKISATSEVFSLMKIFFGSPFQISAQIPVGAR